MLTPDILNAFVQRDTQVIADTLVGGSLIGTDVGDRVLAAARNYPDRFDALHRALVERGAWEAAA